MKRYDLTICDGEDSNCGAFMELSEDGDYILYSAFDAVKGALNELRPEVLAFARLMEAQLRENDHKGGWHGADEDYLLKRLNDEVIELTEACDQRGYAPKSQRKNVGREAADVANFAMMLAGQYKALVAPEPKGEKP